MYLHPLGGVLLQGFGAYRTYYRTALDRLRIQVHVFSVGTYKSALEPFLRDGMSPADAEATSAWLEALWHDYCDEVGAQRHLPATAVHDYAARLPAHLDLAGGDLGVESPSGYLETDVDVRGVVKTGRSTTLTVAYDHVYQDDVPRWDQVAQRGYSRYAFDPQVRQFAFARLDQHRTDSWVDGLSVTGIPVYRFEGAGEGRYIVGKKLPLPQSHTIYTARLSTPSSSRLDVDLQYNVSDFDANTLSGIGDDDKFDWGGIVGAIIGAIIVVAVGSWLFRKIAKRDVV